MGKLEQKKSSRKRYNLISLRNRNPERNTEWGENGWKAVIRQESYDLLCFSQELKDKNCLVLVALVRLLGTQPLLELDPPASNAESCLNF